MLIQQYFERQTDTECVHVSVIELQHPILPSNKRTSNIVQPITTDNQYSFHWIAKKGKPTIYVYFSNRNPATPSLKYSS